MDEKALVLFDSLSDLEIKELNDKQIKVWGTRIAPFIGPQAEIKIPKNMLLYALYCRDIGLNTLTGPYAWEQDGKLYIHHQYGLTIAWAKSIADYIEWFEDEPRKHHAEVGEDDLITRAYVLRNDEMQKVKMLTEIGVKDAIYKVASTSVGVLSRYDRFYVKSGKPSSEWNSKNPPKGWTWMQMCEKRALVAAIHRKFGAPSLRDLARLRQDHMAIGEPEVIEGEWESVRDGASPEEAAKTMEVESKAAEVIEELSEKPDEEVAEVVEKASEELYGKKEEDTSLQNEVSIILAELGDDAEVEDGKHRFKIQALFKELGLDAPDWKESLTVADISEKIKEAMNEQSADGDTG